MTIKTKKTLVEIDFLGGIFLEGDDDDDWGYLCIMFAKVSSSLLRSSVIKFGRRKSSIGGRQQQWNSSRRISETAMTKSSIPSNSKDEDSTMNPKNLLRDDTADEKDLPLYLHVGPSGDCWTGHSIFAAKHLQPDYVKSIPLDSELLVDVDLLLELLEEQEVAVVEMEEQHNGETVESSSSWSRRIYDEGIIPPELLDRFRNVRNGQER